MNKTLFALLFPFLNLLTMHAADPGSGGGGDDDQGGGDDGDGSGKSDDDNGDKNANGDGGKSKPTDEEARLLKEVMDKKNKLQKQGEQLASLQQQLKAFEGIDPTAVRALLAEQATAEENRLKAAGEYETLTKQMKEAHAKDLEKVSGEVGTLKSDLAKANERIVELTIGNSFSQSKYVTENTLLTPAKARKLYAEHFELNEDGVLVGYDRSVSDAKKAPLVDASGEPLQFEVALAQIIDADPDRDSILKSKLKPGANSKTESGGGKGSGQGKQQEKLTGKEKITAGLAQALKNSQAVK